MLTSADTRDRWGLEAGASWLAQPNTTTVADIDTHQGHYNGVCLADIALNLLVVCTFPNIFNFLQTLANSTQNVPLVN